MTPGARTRTVALGIAVGAIVLGVGCGPKPKYHTAPDSPSGSSRPGEVAESPEPRRGSPSPARGRVEAVAGPWIGTPYRYGGVDSRGIDCSGLSQNVMGELGVSLPRTVREQSRLGRSIPLKELRPGDLVFFRLEPGRTNHVGIALDANRFVHASMSRGVVVDRIMDRYFARRIVEVRRVLGERGENP